MRQKYVKNTFFIVIVFCIILNFDHISSLNLVLEALVGIHYHCSIEGDPGCCKVSILSRYTVSCQKHWYSSLETERLGVGFHCLINHLVNNMQNHVMRLPRHNAVVPQNVTIFKEDRMTRGGAFIACPWEPHSDPLFTKCLVILLKSD